MHRPLTRFSLVGIAILAFATLAISLFPPRAFATEPNSQPWAYVPGTCIPEVMGAIFARAEAGIDCGGSGTSFDNSEIYPPMVIQDVASPGVPCEAGRTSGACYRMWYVGLDGANTRRIGYAVSPDGITWTRVPGSRTGGSVFEGSGIAGDFDSVGTSTLSVLRDGNTFRMWYTGIGANAAIEGIGYATSTDGLNWTRVPGSAGSAATSNNRAVLVERGGATHFDRTYVVAPSVLIDEASTLLPCEGGRTSGRCYRMWYEGVNDNPYMFRIGHALSPDGVNWTRVLAGSDGAIFGPGPGGTFDENSVGVPWVIKDGALYRMWYEAKDYTVPDRYTTGYAVSTDGITWVRAVPNEPVWEASDIPGAVAGDNVWAVRALKRGATYDLRFTVSIRPFSQRFALAQMTPGTALTGISLSRIGGSYTLNFTTDALPAGGSVLLTLPSSIPFAQVTPGTMSGFGSATLVADPAAITDGASSGVARGALLIRLGDAVAAGPKTVRFSLASVPTGATPLLIQTFSTREVRQYSEINLLDATIQTDLQISVTNNATSLVPGTQVTYTIIATNNSSDTLSGITVANTFPAGLNGVSWSCSAGPGSSCQNPNGTGSINTLVTLAGGEQATFSATGTLAAGISGTYATTATIAPPNGIVDVNSANDSATDSDPLTPQADLAISSTNTALVPGTPVTYTLTVANNGPSSVSGARVTDTLPEAIRDITWACSATPGSSCAAPNGSDTVDTLLDLDVGGQATLVISGYIPANTTGTASNTANIGPPVSVTDPAPANNTANDSAPYTPRADLAITKSSEQVSTIPGDPASYILVITNNGPSIATGAHVLDSVPETLTNIAWSCTSIPGSSCTATTGSGAVDTTVSLAVGGQVNIRVTGTLASTAEGDLITTSTVTAPAGTLDPELSNNTVTASDTLTPWANLGITLSAGQDTITVGQNVSYSIIVTNHGPSAVAGARAIHIAPEALQQVTWTCSAGDGAACPAANGNGQIDALVDLGVGAQVTFVISGRVEGTITSVLELTASVTAPSGIVDADLTNNSVTEQANLNYNIYLPLVVTP